MQGRQTEACTLPRADTRLPHCGLFPRTLKKLVHAPVLEVQEQLVDGASLFRGRVDPGRQGHVVCVAAQRRVNQLGESESESGVRSRASLGGVGGGG